LTKRCAYCGRYFVPDPRVGNRQKAYREALCRRPDVEYVLRLPASIAGGIQDEIRLQRLDSRTFAARGP